MAINKRYLEEFGNYKSDKHKSKRLLKYEVSFLLTHTNLSKKSLIEIRDLLLKLDGS